VTYRPRWDVGLAAGLAAGLVGVVLGSATVVAAGVVGLAFAAYGYATRPPEARVQVAREVSNDAPAPGADVEIDVTVRNASDGPLAEIRVVDDPPEDLPVVEGTPAHCTSLDAGETTSFTYTVRSRRGSHRFGDVSVLARNVSGTVEHDREVELSTELTCRAGLDDLPLSPQTTPYSGRVDADAPGEGIAFHSTRQFRPADPMHRIDWKRFAKDRELTTVQYQETRAATVVVLVDAREEIRVARRDGEHDAGEYCAFAAARIAGVQLGASNRVGAALYGRTEFLEPAAGREHNLRIGRFLQAGLADPPSGTRSLFDTDRTCFDGVDTVDPEVPVGRDHQVAPDGGSADGAGTTGGDDAGGSSWSWSLSWLARRLPGDAQVVFCTPLLDDRAANTARQLDARGHEVTVVSPDVTSDETPGGLVERVERRQRVRELRASVRLVEWAPEEALATAVDRSSGGWS
jgi:uncharacterized protein (DUF58 family)